MSAATAGDRRVVVRDWADKHTTHLRRYGVTTFGHDWVVNELPGGAFDSDDDCIAAVRDQCEVLEAHSTDIINELGIASDDELVDVWREYPEAAEAALKRHATFSDYPDVYSLKEAAGYWLLAEAACSDVADMLAHVEELSGQLDG